MLQDPLLGAKSQLQTVAEIQFRPDDARNSPLFLKGGGEMGALIRSMDWSKTPLGPPESWPQSPRTTLTLPGFQFPPLLARGPQRVQNSNDGYTPVCAAKQPRSSSHSAPVVRPPKGVRSPRPAFSGTMIGPCPVTCVPSCCAMALPSSAHPGDVGAASAGAGAGDSVPLHHLVVRRSSKR